MEAKIVIWLTENSNANITKLAISNYSSTLTQASSPVGDQRLNFGLFTENGIFNKLLRFRLRTIPQNTNPRKVKWVLYTIGKPTVPPISPSLGYAN